MNYCQKLTKVVSPLKKEGTLKLIPSNSNKYGKYQMNSHRVNNILNAEENSFGHSQTRDDVINHLRLSGLRPTRQRIAISDLLFSQGDRHVSAEELKEETIVAKIPVSLATIYNTLHQFTEVGLLRAIAVDGAKTYFDTNTSNHHHFYHEETGKISDITKDEMIVLGIPTPPEKQEVWRIDVIIRLKDI